MRLYILFVLFNLFSVGSYAMQDTVLYRRVSRPQQNGLLDSVAAASVARHQFVSDSLAMIYIQHQDPLRKNQFVEEMLKNNVYKGYGFLDIKTRSKAGLGMGQVRKIRDSWMLGIVAGLLLYAALLRLFLTRDIGNIVQSFYDKQLSSPPDNDTKTLSLWAFLGLLILFGLTFGLFLYQISAYYQVYYTVGGTALYFSLAGGVVLLFCLKLLLLKFLGFVFSINKVVDRYITILCFTYFAITFVFLPVVVCLCLLTVQLIPFILLIAILLTAAILVWLYLRNSLIIISHFQFSKFYLFVYLCALEICPILILMKALNI